MSDREIMECKVSLKVSKLTKEQKFKVQDLMEEHHDALSSCNEIRTCPQADVHLKLCNEAPFVVCHMQ